MNYLDLDYGQMYLGIALATGPLAEPLTTIPTPKALTFLPRLISTHQIKGLVVGLTEGPIRPSLNKFIHSLKILNCPIITHPETLSTHDAITGLLHTTRSRRKTMIHAAAAAIILQSWLDSVHSQV